MNNKIFSKFVKKISIEVFHNNFILWKKTHKLCLNKVNNDIIKKISLKYHIHNREKVFKLIKFILVEFLELLAEQHPEIMLILIAVEMGYTISSEIYHFSKLELV